MKHLPTTVPRHVDCDLTVMTENDLKDYFDDDFLKMITTHGVLERYQPTQPHATQRQSPSHDFLLHCICFFNDRRAQKFGQQLRQCKRGEDAVNLLLRRPARSEPPNAHTTPLNPAVSTPEPHQKQATSSDNTSKSSKSSKSSGDLYSKLYLTNRKPTEITSSSDRSELPDDELEAPERKLIQGGGGRAMFEEVRP